MGMGGRTQGENLAFAKKKRHHSNWLFFIVFIKRALKFKIQCRYVSFQRKNGDPG
jgi:hypothetical protein